MATKESNFTNEEKQARRQQERKARADAIDPDRPSPKQIVNNDDDTSG